MSIKKFLSFTKGDKFDNVEITQLSKKDINKNSTVITNSSAVMDYTVNVLQIKAFENNEKPITQSCISELTEHFGKHNTTFKGSEYNTKVWIVEYADLIFEIFTAKGFGTQVVVDLTLDEVQSGKYDDLLKSFSNKLYNILNK